MLSWDELSDKNPKEISWDSLSDAPPPTKETGTLRSLADSGIALTRGVLTGGKMVSDAFGAGNVVSEGLKSGIDFVSEYESPARIAEKQERARLIQEADASGSTWESIKAYLGTMKDAPIDTVLEAIGTMGPTVAAALVPGGQAVLGARLGAAVVGGVQGAGVVKGSIYEVVEQKLKDSGATEEVAKARASEAQEYFGKNAASIAGGIGAGVLAGGTGVEKLLTGAGASAKNLAVRGLIGAGAEAIPEGIQGGQEKYATNVALQREGFDVPTWQGVAGSSALEATASAPIGGGFAMLKGAPQDQTPGTPLPDPLSTIVDKVMAPEVDTIDKAIAEAGAGLMGTPSTSPVAGKTTITIGDKESVRTSYQDGSVEIDGVQVTPPRAAPIDTLAQAQAELDAANATQDLTGVLDAGLESMVRNLFGAQSPDGRVNTAEDNALGKAAQAELDRRKDGLIGTPTGLIGTPNLPVIPTVGTIAGTPVAPPTPAPTTVVAPEPLGQAPQIPGIPPVARQPLPRITEDQYEKARVDPITGGFPIMGARPGVFHLIPWSLIAHGEAQAQKNHAKQTLARLAQRGGLSASEALALIQVRTDELTVSDSEANVQLQALIEASQKPDVKVTSTPVQPQGTPDEQSQIAKPTETGLEATTPGLAGTAGEVTPTGGTITAAELISDIPNEEWLAGKVRYANEKGRDSYGAPYIGVVTGRFSQDVTIPLSVLTKLKGLKNEQNNVRQADLESLKKVMGETGKLPLRDGGKEYAPFVVVNHAGEAWVSEGNHRIMAAQALGWESMPIEVRYFDGGERAAGPMNPTTLLSTKTKVDPKLTPLSKRIKGDTEPAAAQEPPKVTDGDMIRFTANDGTVTEGMALQVDKTSGGNVRYRIQTDQDAAQGGGKLSKTVYSQDGKVENLTAPVTATPVTEKPAKVSAKEAAIIARATETESFNDLVSQPDMIGKSIEDLTTALTERLPNSKPNNIAKMAKELHKQILKNADTLEKEKHRDPAILADSIKSALPDSLNAQEVQAFQLGYMHALSGKTKSTLAGENLSVLLQGYEAAKSWIKTEQGRAFYEGRPVSKLQNTGVDLRRHWELMQAELKAKQTDITKAWAAIERATNRAELLAPLMPDGVKPGFKIYVTEVRSQIKPFKEWLENRVNWYGSTKYRGRGRWRSSTPDRSNIDYILEGSRHPEGLNGDEQSQWFTDEAYRADYLREKAENYLEQVREFTSIFDGGVDSVAVAAANFAEKFTDITQPWGTNDAGIDIRNKLLNSSRSEFMNFAPDSNWVKGLIEKEDTIALPNRKKPLIQPKLDRVTREGLEGGRNGRNVTPAEFKAHFGFEDIGFGTSVASKQDQDHLNYAFDAFNDLAKHFGTDPKNIGIGKLHLTIGALGHSKASAHFQSQHPFEGGYVQVINLTNTNGDGTVYHEWTHALDHNLGGDWKNTVRPMVLNILKQQARTVESVEQRAKDFLIGGWHYTSNKKLGKVAAAMRALDSMRDKATSYKTNADKMGKDYWGNDQELIARASEAWATDTLGGVNTYLVNPAWSGESKITDENNYIGTPYPTGEERKRFNDMYTGLAKSVKWDNGKATISLDDFKKNTSDSGEVAAEARRAELVTLKGMTDFHNKLLAEVAAAKQERADAVTQTQRDALDEKNRLIAEETDRLTQENLVKQEPIDLPRPSEAQGPLTDEELDALLDQASSELREQGADEPDKLSPGARMDASVEEAKTPLIAEITRIKQTKDNASALIAAAVKDGVTGADEFLNGLSKLFDGKGADGSTKLYSFPGGFDQETYDRAKPHFVGALALYKKSGKSLLDLFKMLIQHFGEGIKMYLKQFAKDEALANNLGNDVAKDGETEDTITKGDENDPRVEEQGDGALEGIPTPEVGGTGGGRSGGRGSGSGSTGRRKGNSATDGAGGEAGRGRGDSSAGVDPATTGTGGRGRGTAGDGSKVPKGDGDTDVNLSGRGSAVRDGASGLKTQYGEVIPAAVPAVNFIITPDLDLGSGGPAIKYSDNIAAIRVLKLTESEHRRATSDEQRILARYVGWGGMPNAFRNPVTGDVKEDWASKVEELESLLSAKELRAASASTPNAHFTSETVTGFMWRAAVRMGFSGGMVLEPSVGSGNFIGMMPESARTGSYVTGIELDSITARIATALYPQSNIVASGFEKTGLPEETFDLAIGNPPFGSNSLRFKYSPELNRKSIHNQFFLGSMNAVKPGGLQVMVVSRYLMDAQDSATREQLAIRAELLGAIRLPGSAFKGNAGTEVVTDILFLKKRSISEQAELQAAFYARDAKIPTKESQSARFTRVNQANQLARELAWTKTTKVDDPLGGEDMVVSQYFADNPNMIAGVMDRSGSMQFGADIDVKLPVRELAARLDAMMRFLPGFQSVSISEEADQRTQAMHKALGESMSIMAAGREVGSIYYDESGKLTEIVERIAEDGSTLASKNVITARSPWSPQLSLNMDGKWYKTVPKLDATGKKVKVGNRNVWIREIYENESDIGAGLRLGDEGLAKLKKLVAIRELYVEQINLETNSSTHERMEANRLKLRTAYKAFVAAHGFISERNNAEIVSDMPDEGLLLSLELKFKPAVSIARAKFKGIKPSPASANENAILTRPVAIPPARKDSADNVSDALAISLGETGRIDVQRVAKLRDISEEAALEELTGGETPLAYIDPETNEVTEKNQYLSGNVRKKLIAASDAKLQKNSAALLAIQPEPWSSDKVTAHLGASWVPPNTYAQFVKHLLGRDATVTFSKLTNTFNVFTPDRATAVDEATWGTVRANAVPLLNSILNNKRIAIYDGPSDAKVLNAEETQSAIDKKKEIIEEFDNWIFKEADRRQELTRLFNDLYNTRVNRQYDGSHMTFPSKVADSIVKFRRSQINGIWRGIVDRFTMYDHAVGAGKTFTGISRAMERKRMGLSNKPVIVVPNHLVSEWSTQAYRLYPGAKILAASKKDLAPKNRRRLFANIAAGDWDVVIIPHSSFQFISISPETEERYLEDELRLAREALQEAEDDKDPAMRFKPLSVKAAENLIKKLEDKLDRVRGATSKDQLLTFEQMGIDDLTIDESHEFKNLTYVTKLTDVRGLGPAAGSQRAFDLYTKMRILHETNGSAVFMTGTPISNSAVEMYSIMRYLAPIVLKDSGLEHFDAFRAQYVVASEKHEPTEAGDGLKIVNRLGRNWSNMRSLMDGYYSFADVVTNDDIKAWYAEDNPGKEFPLVKVKGGGRRTIVSKPTPTQQTLIEQVIAGYNNLPNTQDLKQRNIDRLRLMDQARKLALHAKVWDKSLTDEAGGKLDKVVDEAMRLYRAFLPDKGTQLIFLDRSVPKAQGDKKLIDEYDALRAKLAEAIANEDEARQRAAIESLESFDVDEIDVLREAQMGGWNAYQHMADSLIAKGVPKEQIAFIQQYNTDAQKLALFEAVNDGAIRFLFGSSARMGSGMNVQERLVGLHHVDVGWKPSEVEQREGRIIRQGNRIAFDEDGNVRRAGFEVEILAYVTERSIDAKMWDLNATKMRMVNGIRYYDGEFEMEFNDDEAIDMAEIAAIASGDPLMLERIKVTTTLDELYRKRRSYNRRIESAQDALRDTRKELVSLPVRIEKEKALAKVLSKAFKKAKSNQLARTITVDGKKTSSTVEALSHAGEAIKVLKEGDANKPFTLDVDGKSYTSEAAVQEAIAEKLGDVEAFEAEVGGQKVIRRTAVAREIRKMIGDVFADHERASIGTIYGIPIFMKANVLKGQYSWNSGSYVGLTAEVVYEGGVEKVTESRNIEPEKHKEGTPVPVLTSTLRIVVDHLGNSLNRRSIDYTDALTAKLKTAQENIPAYEAAEKEKFKHADELDAALLRLNDIQDQLAARATAASVMQPGLYDVTDPDGDVEIGRDLSADDIKELLGHKYKLVPTKSQDKKGDAGSLSILSTTGKSKPLDASLRIAETAIADEVGKRIGGFAHKPTIIIRESALGVLPGVEAGDSVSGAVHKGAIYLFKDQLGSRSDVQRTLFHELLHYGLRRFLTRDQFISKMNELYSRDKWIKDRSDAWVKTKEGAAAKKYGGDDYAKARGVDEALAKLAEISAGEYTKTDVRSVTRVIVSRWVARIAEFLGFSDYASKIRALKNEEARQLIKDVFGQLDQDARPARDLWSEAADPAFSSRTTLNEVTKTLQELASPIGTVTFWDRTVGTQYHKSTKDADFKRVFDGYRQQTNDTAHYAIEAENNAPDILMRLESFGDIFKGLAHSGKKQKVNLVAVSKALFANIEGVKGIKQKKYNSAELKSLFNLTPKQIEMYHQARGAVDTSIDRLAQTFAAQMGRDHGMNIETLKNMTLDDTSTLVKEHIQARDDEARVLQKLAQEAAAQGEDAAIPKAPTEAVTKTNIDRIDALVEHAKFLQETGYMPAMRFGEFAVTVVGKVDEAVFGGMPMADPVDEVLHFEMFESKTMANIAKLKLAKEYPNAVITTSVMNPEQYAMFKGVSPETVELFAKFNGMDQNEAYQNYIALAKSSRSVKKRELRRKGIAGFSEDATRVIASFVYSNARQSAINMNIGEITDALASKSLARKGDVQREAQKLSEYLKNPQEEARQLRSFMFMYFLGGSFASAAVNLTQTVMQTGPYLSQFTGAKTIGIMLKAMKQATTGNIDNAVLREAAKKAKEEGHTEPNEIHQLMADASNSAFGSNLKGRAVIKTWGSMFALAEAYNRRVTFLAAYQVALDIKNADPYAFAVKAIIETQGLYAKENRPNWARGPVGAVVFTFKQFTIAYLEFIVRLPNKQKAIALGILILAAGIQGLPGADDLDDLIDTIGQSMGHNTNSSKWKRKFLIDTFGEDLGNILHTGILSQGAIGASSRLSMGNLFPGTAMFKPSDPDKSRAVAELAGPISGILAAFQKALAKAQQGETGGALQEMSPVAIKNLLKGFEMASTGVYKDTKGGKVNDVDAMDSFVKMLGFQPGHIAQKSRIYGDEMQDKGMTAMMESMIADRWAQGIHEKDQDKVKRARETLAAWNKTNPGSRIVINPNQIRSRIRAMEMSRVRRFIKTVPKEQRRQVAGELQ